MMKEYFEYGIFRNNYLDNVIRIYILKVFTISKALITQNAITKKIFLFFIFKI